MASDLPTPESYEQLVADMLSAYAAKLKINDFNVGSAVTGFFEVVGLTTARASGDVFQILRDFSVDRATGDALKRLAIENNVTPIGAKVATGLVNVIDDSFTKISTKIYAGTNPPNIGSVAINASDASQFTPTGSVYIGRGTPNVEGPLPYTSVTPFGGFFIINLTSPTTKFHNVGETIILAQGGNRSVGVNTIVISPGVGSSADIQYSVTTSAVILDGETEVDNVLVSAQTPGSSGNVPAGAIKSFASPPFSGATVTNPLPFTTGSDSETDDQLRVRIKRSLASKGLGTATAVKSALIGATPSDENATIVSDSLVVNTDGSATVYVDDGNGYEAKSAGVGLESIVDSALGGEQFFQLQTGGRQAPVAKAFLQTTLAAPFDLINGDTLAVVVGGIVYQHVFTSTDFRSPGGATAFEVTASINADTFLGFEATTAGGGQFVVIRSKTEGNDSLKTTTPTTSGRDAAILMGFPSNTVETLRLYKNDIPLSKDGATASIFTQNQQLWSSTIQNGDTIILNIDGTASITFTITDADFIATGLYTTVSNTNSLASWAQVFNNKITGVTTTVVGQQLELTSNLGANNRASLDMQPAGSLVSKGMFSSSIGLSSQGKASDFTLDRNTAQFQLVTPLQVGDKLSAGSLLTEAKIESAQISGGNITFSSDAHVWLLIDNPGEIINTGVIGNTVLSVTKPSTNVIRYTSAVSGAFNNVLVGDYVIVWSQELSAPNRIEGRVHAFTATTLDILITATEWAAVVLDTNIVFLDGFVVLRTTLPPQKFRIQAGNKTLDQIAQELQSQTSDLVFSVFQEQSLVIVTTTKDPSGFLLVVTVDNQGKLLNLPVGTSDVSKDSLIAFYDSGDFEGELPLFIHAAISGGVVADPIDSYISSFVSSISLAGRDPNELIGILHPYGAIRDAQPFGEFDQETSISGSTIGIAKQPYVRRLRVADRYFLANPFDFGSQDTSVVVLDGDTSNKSFQIPFYRRGIANTTHISNPTDFNAYDVDSGNTAQFSVAFGATFDFSNFKVLMQARKVLKPTPAKTAILYRATKWGRSGEKISVGYIYPSVPNSPIGHVVSVGSTIPMRISLKSGGVSSNSIDLTTEWNVTVTPNVPSVGIDQVTFTWNGVGTNPALTLSGGEYVNISTQTAFSPQNTGIFRVSTQAGFTPTATSFSVQQKNGVAVAETNKATQVNGAINLFSAGPTTAADIKAYVDANLTDFFSATLVNDGGTDGSGVIVLSTYEDSGFAYDSVFLLDGINWISSSNLSGDPQFIFKAPLALPTDVGYAFNNGEEVRIIPTTIEQIARLISVLAVTGFTSVGNVEVVDRSNRLELSTRILGSSGAIQIIGGLANEYSVPVLDSASRLDNTYMEISTDKVSSQGVHSDQWFRLQAEIVQSKIAGLSSNTSVTIVGNSPISGESIVTLLGKQLNQRYFGKPRHHIRSRGRNFRVEKQGGLTCISWDKNGSSPIFVKSSLNFNDTGGGTVNVSPVLNTSEVQYVILTGNANFTELSIGDLVTVAGMVQSKNNGTFLVTGVSDNGKTIQVLNPNSKAQFSHGTFTFTGNANLGDQFTVGATILIAGIDFPIGGTAAITAANLAATIAALPLLTASANGNIVTITATSAGQVVALTYTPSYIFTVSPANATVGATYTNNGQTFTVVQTIVAGTTLTTTGTGAPLASGTLTKTGGTGDATITFSSFSNTTQATASGPFLAGDSFVAGNFTASSGVSEGDTVIFSAPFSVLNQGKFRVIREYSDSIWIENPNTVEEEVTLPYNPISLGFDATTSFKIDASNNSQYLTWNGIGTEPSLGNTNLGDIITFGTDFAAANQGDFMVVNYGSKLQEITQFTVPTGAQFILGGAGKYFKLFNAGDANKYYVWFNVNSTNTDPAPGGGFAGVEVDILSGDNATQVAAKLAAAITGQTINISTSALGAIVTTTTTGSIETSDAFNFNVPAPFSVQITQQGRRGFLECINPSVVAQATVLVTGGVLQDHRPQMQFSEYDASVVGDKFVVTGTVLGASNVGSYPVVQVLNRTTAIVNGSLANVTNVSLNNNLTAVSIQEGVLYSGYKHVFLSAPQEGASNRNFLVFDTNAQYEKINQAAGVALTSLSKLNFSTVIRNGLDSYRFNTGLIAEANRIVYGDPRDSTTYPGVGAAGADIFIREPLTRRVQVSIDVRINTGVPFAQTVDQVRTSVSSLVNSNPVGSPIAISSIISAVNAIPGVRAVAIDSPQFDSTHDLIFIAPSEKARIIDPTLDVSVNQIGS